MTESRPFRLLYVAALLSVFAVSYGGALSQETGRGVALGGGAGRYHALVIGNNEYRSVPRLKTAENDARAVEAILRESYGFRTRLLLNATRQQILSALNAYRRELDAESSLLIYYAGHGVNDKEIDKAYWLPVDAGRDDNANWISADDITSNIRGVPAKHVLIVSDSCYSGTLTRGFDPTASASAVRDRYLQKMAAGRSRTLMASGGNEPVADDGGVGNHSVFASAFVRGLRETEKTAFTAAELYREYVEEAVAGRASQTPEYNPLRNSGHESGDFVFARVKTADGKSVEVTVRTQPAASLDPAAVELSFWETIKGSTDPEDFREYLAKYPAGQFAGLARRRAAALTAEPATGNSGGAAPKPSPAQPSGDEGKKGSATEYDDLINRAASAGASRDFAGALRYAEQAARLDPQQPRAYDMIGRLKLYFNNDLKSAEQAMRAAIERGGGASFRVFHDHTGSFQQFCEGSFYVTKAVVLFKADDGQHSFEAADSNIKEVKVNALVGSGYGAFHIKFTEPVSGKTNFNFAPLTKSKAESELLIRLIKAY